LDNRIKEGKKSAVKGCEHNDFPPAIVVSQKTSNGKREKLDQKRS